MKRAGLNHLEKSLVPIRQRFTRLPEEARRGSFGSTYAHVLWLRDKFAELAEELYAIENQEELCLDETTPNKNGDR
jgi:hypothetical protein